MSTENSAAVQIINDIKTATTEDKLVWKPVPEYLEDAENEALIDFIIENDPYQKVKPGQEFDCAWVNESLAIDLDQAVIFFLNDSANRWTLCAQLKEEQGLGPIAEVDVPQIDKYLLLQEVLMQQKRFKKAEE